MICSIISRSFFHLVVAAMSDKKNDDYVVSIPKHSDDLADEKDPFMAASSSFSPSHQVQNDRKLADPLFKIRNSPGISLLAYCLASISMTLVNKYVVSGSSWNLNFFYLAIQVSSNNIFLGRTNLIYTSLPCVH